MIIDLIMYIFGGCIIAFGVLTTISFHFPGYIMFSGIISGMFFIAIGRIISLLEKIAGEKVMLKEQKEKQNI